MLACQCRRHASGQLEACSSTVGGRYQLSRCATSALEHTAAKLHPENALFYECVGICSLGSTIGETVFGHKHREGGFSRLRAMASGRGIIVSQQDGCENKATCSLAGGVPERSGHTLWLVLFSSTCEVNLVVLLA